MVGNSEGEEGQTQKEVDAATEADGGASHRGSQAHKTSKTSPEDGKATEESAGLPSIQEESVQAESLEGPPPNWKELLMQYASHHDPSNVQIMTRVSLVPKCTGDEKSRWKAAPQMDGHAKPPSQRCSSLSRRPEIKHAEDACEDIDMYKMTEVDGGAEDSGGGSKSKGGKQPSAKGKEAESSTRSASMRGRGRARRSGHGSRSGGRTGGKRGRERDSSSSPLSERQS